MNKMSDKILNFYLLIMAIPLAIIIDDVYKNPEYNVVLRFLMLLLIIVEWLYTQSSFTEEYEYSPKLGPISNVVTLISEVCICFSAAFAAYTLSCESNFYIFIIAFFASDLITQLITKPRKSSHIMHKVVMTWVTLDIVELCFFSAGLIFFCLDALSESFRSTILIIVVTTCTLYDILHNADFYFRQEKSGTGKPPCGV